MQAYPRLKEVRDKAGVGKEAEEKGPATEKEIQESVMSQKPRGESLRESECVIECVQCYGEVTQDENGEQTVGYIESMEAIGELEKSS